MKSLRRGIEAVCELLTSNRICLIANQRHLQHLIKHQEIPLWILSVIISCEFVEPIRAQNLIGLYNTGVSSSGGLLADGSADPHYSLVSSADQSIKVPVSAIVADSSKYPFVPGGWLPDGPNSKWIDPLADQSIGNPPGDYIYETTFQLAGVNPTSVVISGQWSLDNIGKGILINGHSTGIYYDAPGDYTFKAFQTFVLPSNYFVEGTNTLDFVVSNTDNGNGNTPTGIRVELSAYIQLAPEPSPLVLLGTTMLALLGYGWCRRNSAGQAGASVDPKT